MNSDSRMPAQIAKQHRDKALNAFVQRIPYIEFLGISFERHGDELTGVLAFDGKLIGNPYLPALHGGVTAAFLEVAAIIELSWSCYREDFEAAEAGQAPVYTGNMPRLPKTIDFTVDYLRPGLPRDAYARARVNRSGRRYASVHVEAWQDRRSRLFAQATGHFLMPAQVSMPA